MYPYAALRGPTYRKNHTMITLRIRHRAQLLVSKPRRRRPCGFDSHRPLHFPANLRTRRDTGLESGWRFALAVAANFVLGALMCVGIGNYVPSMALLAFLGIHTIVVYHSP